MKNIAQLQNLADFDNKSLLIVDDDNPFRERLARAMEKKGFKVFSVSLDRSAASWKKAIKQDRLNWPWHISDLKWWNSAYASLYKIQSIPENILINPSGQIVAKNLRGKTLDNVLETYLYKPNLVKNK